MFPGGFFGFLIIAIACSISCVLFISSDFCGKRIERRLVRVYCTIFFIEEEEGHPPASWG